MTAAEIENAGITTGMKKVLSSAQLQLNTSVTKFKKSKTVDLSSAPVESAEKKKKNQGAGSFSRKASEQKTSMLNYFAKTTFD